MESKDPNTPKGFLTVEEACELIKSDTRSDAKVDTKYLVSHINWIETQHNFRIPLVRTATKEDIEAQLKARPGVRPKPIVETGSVYVAIETAFQRELLAQTIRDHYRDLAGKEFEEERVRAVSTVADEEGSGMKVNPRKSTPIAKEGDTINSGHTMTTNSDGMKF